ncbi:MAG: CHRD domain-containing protein [Phormidesmis sp.]
MTESNVVASSLKNTPARGAVGAVLSGNRLIVRGSFKMLSSDMRNYATDPVNPPNADITSAFHIHQGTPMENGPFQYALNVMLDDDGRSGSAMGEYTLTEEQMQALASNQLYVDIHTTKNRGGELRGTLMPY